MSNTVSVPIEIGQHVDDDGDRLGAGLAAETELHRLAERGGGGHPTAPGDDDQQEHPRGGTTRPQRERFPRKTTLESPHAQRETRPRNRDQPQRLGEVRGAGLYLGIDVADPATGAPSADLASAIVNGMRERRVLISATGPQGSVLKVRPPLPFGPEHADQFLAALVEVTAGLG